MPCWQSVNNKQLEVNNMSDMKKLSNDTIQLQHEVRLTSKKVDVVGVIQSKVKDNIESLLNAVSDYHADVLKIDTESISEGREHLVNQYQDLKNQHALVLEQLGQLLDQTDSIDQSLSESRQNALEELNRQQIVTTVQMDNLADSVADASQKLDDHIKQVDLSDIEQGVMHIDSKMETFLSDINASREKMDIELANMSESMDNLSNQQETIGDLNELFHNTVKTLRETLKSIDDKVCQISPLYTGPSARDIEESFNQMASTDIAHLMNELHDKYQQTMQGVVGDESSDDVESITESEESEPMEKEKVAEPTSIIVTLPDDAPKEHSVVENDSNGDSEQPRKGFFSRLFGGDD